MNILILNWRDITHPEGGGAEVHLHELFGRLVKRGHTVTLLTTRYKGAERECTIDGMRVLRWGSTFLFNWEAPLLIARFRRSNPVDIIVDDVNKIPFFTPFWVRDLPSVVFFHHLFGKTIFELAAWPFARYVLFLERLSGRGYKKNPCCTVSPSTADELVEIGFDRKKITIIENSVDTDLYTCDPTVKKVPGMLLYTGRLKSYKNVGSVIDALKILTEKGYDLTLVVAGSGDDEPALKRRAVQAGVADRVTFAGFVSEAKKVELYRQATVFVNPSMKEGWGITNIEANACGTAVVANNAHGIRDAVKDGVTGLLYRENSLDDLVIALEQVLSDEPLRSSLIENGKQWAASFSWDANAGKVETWLQASR